MILCSQFTVTTSCLSNLGAENRYARSECLLLTLPMNLPYIVFVSGLCLRTKFVNGRDLTHTESKGTQVLTHVTLD